ncbi:MAG TPA: type II toxin-antitoxin system VapC family toxin [Burkholderiales bacterium]|nr:type II toxin-antitoxin system VapC family toxin [Burkholderiales bacterium]
MAFVLDASVALGWVVARQASTYGRRMRLRARREPYHAPGLWRLEVANALRSLERRRNLSSDAADAAIDILSRMQPVIHEATMPLVDLLRLARKYDLSSYAASYLALALELRMPIACGDGALKSVLTKAGVKLA